MAVLLAVGAISWLFRVGGDHPAARHPAAAAVRRLLDHAVPAALAAMVGAGIAGGAALPDLASRLPVLARRRGHRGAGLAQARDRPAGDGGPGRGLGAQRCADRRVPFVAEFVRLEVDGGIGVIRLDRPPMNAISRQVQEELVTTAAEAANRADVRAVVVYGGEKVLAAGADVKEMAEDVLRRHGRGRAALSAGFGAMADDPEARPWPRSPATRSAAAGAGAGVRPAHRGRQRQARPARDPARRHPGRRRHPAARPAGRPVAGEGPHPHRTDGRRPRRRSPSASSTRSCPPTRCSTRAME